MPFRSCAPLHETAMVSGITNNTLIAQAFGKGTLRPERITPNLSAPDNSAFLAQTPDTVSLQPVDRVEFSDRALRLLANSDSGAAAQASTQRAQQHQGGTSAAKANTIHTDPSKSPTQPSDNGSTAQASTSRSKNASGQPLTPEDEKEVRKLKDRDREVRQHEQAHKAAAGQHANGGPSFDYTAGPDGKRYATGGEVSIDTSKVKGDPRATIAKMQQVRRAALSPTEPSSQDRSVAAQAAATEQEARAELAKQQSTEAPPPSTTGETTATASPGTRGSLGDAHANFSTQYGLVNSLANAGSRESGIGKILNLVA